ncbi:chemerin-like receptor 2 [Bombina bombina]|uniref:chemerin-like receptor 2 n=1 Tax=Bombina bombina TaxID=8345 RepID=UPI00235B2112|nr:chemerin-like receptor 2 [Bombina bombina]XP_053547199.1 chemerin-like receptor 2 [Bombina bombina]XP_053547200.1 chemerin-like receptor 2 [Bombina bombina]
MELFNITLDTTPQNITATENVFSSFTTAFENITTSPITKNNVPRTPPRNVRCGDISSSATAIRNLSIFIFTVAFIFGAVGNGLVIWITGFRMKKTVNTIWFLNLAVADFIFTIFLPITISHTALGNWPFGKFMCKISSFIPMFNMFASVYFLTIISADRCAFVVFPVWAQNKRNPKIAVIVATVIWALALALSFPYLAFRDTFFNSKTNLTVCFNNYAFSLDTKNPAIQSLRLMRHKAMIFTRFFGGFLLPFLIIVVCYGIIIMMLRKNRLVAHSRRPLRLIVAVVVTFFICWLPYHIFSLLELSLHGNNCSLKNTVTIGTSLAISLAFINSCVNPILYVFIGRNAQHRIRTSILQVIERALKDEQSQITRTSKTQSKSMSEATSKFL